MNDSEPKVDEALAIAHGLKPEEYQRFVALNVHYDLCIGAGCHLGHAVGARGMVAACHHRFRAEASGGGGDFTAVGGNHNPAQIPGLPAALPDVGLE